MKPSSDPKYITLSKHDGEDQLTAGFIFPIYISVWPRSTNYDPLIPNPNFSWDMVMKNI
jgi:hypothetical protein